MLRTQFCICKCFFTNNMFLKDYNLHVIYRDKAQFIQEYAQVLQSKGCQDPESIIPKLEAESLRRRQLHDESWKRRMQVAKDYKPLHPEIFTLQPSFLDAKFHEIVQLAQDPEQTSEDIIKYMKNHQNRIFSFPVFTTEFCKLFLEEIVNFEESPLPKGRPNTMNQYGISLEELGFDRFISSLRSTYLTPLTTLLFPDWGGDSLDSHKSFIVTYKEGKDVDLTYHFDNAERHGALPISEGVRYNLIIWMRSSQIRNELCPMCDEKPTLVPVKNGYGDGFSMNTVDVCSTV
ncbi:2-oxoglutarate and iron-dependent oxygenase domain-containing protein 2-like [Homarus americanus]|uniref:2-oxoglutarate and iron-dependent oxygenase domain-containing protein 2-like n=1 Tax=Homarus americanus TaxID=6706 RepID=A0A8J5T1Y3_HOMAM|nr:2-oxoglutarate and iron-dependent oxygenase domain-containing protein 2-like [Homarus americanus]